MIMRQLLAALVGCFAALARADKAAALRAFREDAQTPPADGTVSVTCRVRDGALEVRGEFTLELHRQWAPRGVARVVDLVERGYYDGAVFFRALTEFVVQWGMKGREELAGWKAQQAGGEAAGRAALKPLPDEPVRASNKRGTVSFAAGGANTRTCQLFINLNDRNSRLDAERFIPLGEVTGMDVVSAIDTSYKDGQGQVAEYHKGGAAGVRAAFPEMWSIDSCWVQPPAR